MTPNTLKTYDEKKLLAGIQAKARELGRTPKCKDIDKDPKLPSVSTYYAAFGSMTKAIRMAGLTPNRVGRDEKYSDLELLDSLRKKAESLGRIPTSEEVDNDPSMPSYTTYQYHFGTFQKAIRKAGLKQGAKSAQPKAVKYMRYSERELLDRLKEKARILGRNPTQKELKSDLDMPSFSTYVYRFGSFQSACKKAGLLPRKHGRSTKYTDDKLLEMLRNRAKELGRPLGWNDFGKSNNMPPRQVYTYRFGGIGKALKKARIM